MFRLAYTAVKYFTVGLLLGLLTAPRSGLGRGSVAALGDVP
mgnify:CR=1 FL=1